MKKVYGKFETLTEARIVVGDLLERGYEKDQITVISKDNLDCDLEEKREEAASKDESLWEKIKDAFVFDRYHEKYWETDLEECNREDIIEYKEDLEAGYTVVLIDDAPRMRHEPRVEEADIREDLDSDRLDPDK